MISGTSCHYHHCKVVGANLPKAWKTSCRIAFCLAYMLLTYQKRERERELRKEGREVPSRVRLREGPIGVRITLGQPTIG